MSTTVRRAPILPNGVLGMLIFVLTEIMLFAGLVSAHLIFKSGAAVWPPPDQPLLPVMLTGVNTSILIGSGIVAYLAGEAFDKGEERATTLLWISALLGTVFVAVQGYEWVGLIAQGMTLTSSTHGAFFYLIVGTHALHALIAIVALVVMAARARRGTLDKVSFASTRVFWYFVVAVWPVLYWQVYG